jgi:hypothetical protein
MKTIWKFELDAKNLRVWMPVGAKLLTAQGQNDQICVWAEVDSEADKEEVIFEIFGTGHEILTGMGVDREYIGTAQIFKGELVFHVYRWTGV